MKASVIIALALGLALSGCGSAEEDGDAVQGQAVNSADVRSLDAMSEAERHGVLLRALRDGGHDCQAVVSAKRAGVSEGVPLWQAFCRGGRSWIIAVTANGYAQIVRPGPDEAGAGHTNAAAAE